MAIPKKMEAKYRAIAPLINSFSQQYLNDEYEELALKLLEALCRKRPSPIERGKETIWAASIIYAIGSVNFLFDKTQTPHVQSSEISTHFGAAGNTISSKSNSIMKMIPHLNQFDWHWKLPSQLLNNSHIWFVQVNGYVHDIRNLPREVQEQAYQQKIIPFIPADQS